MYGYAMVQNTHVAVVGLVEMFYMTNITTAISHYAQD